MITTRQQLHDCLEKDSKAFKGIAHIPWYRRLLYPIRVNPISDQWCIWRYIYHMRHCEYYLNARRGVKSIYSIKAYYLRLMEAYHCLRLKRYGYKTGFQIPPNTCGAGLTIWHWGAIVINEKARLGENCTLYPGVLIGHKVPGEPAPQIGENCFIASGVKIIGAVTIGDNVTIAQNAVVTHDVPNNVVVGGIPAKVIKIKSH